MIITDATIQYHQLAFKFDAGTSRGTLRTKSTWFLKIYHNEQLIGVGEAGPLIRLSIEDFKFMPFELERVVNGLKGMTLPDSREEVFKMAKLLAKSTYPSIRFAIETALLDAMNGGQRMLFNTPFFKEQEHIPINGLVWMGEKDFMEEQIQQKLKQGFNCIKMKIGAIDFDTELALLRSIREKYSKEQVTLRVDANGAFSPNEAMDKLHQLAELDIHSIEQPIKVGQLKSIKALCQDSPIPIALDEELIGIYNMDEKRQLLDAINPQYLILKPSLIGGMDASKEWVTLCEERNVGWWLTSMLESNIGLNAICQLASHLKVTMPQGLGTGQLYTNNIESPLTIEKGHIFYNQEVLWGSLPSPEPS